MNRHGCVPIKGYFISRDSGGRLGLPALSEGIKKTQVQIPDRSLAGYVTKQATLPLIIPSPRV